MSDVPKNNYADYQLRHAAGQYWLLDMKQSGIPYRQPMSMNDIGAEIWGMMAEGLNRDEIIRRLSEEYEAEPEEIRQDVLQFQKSLAAYGVAIGE